MHIKPTDSGIILCPDNDITVIVDWALKTSYLSFEWTLKADFLSVWFHKPFHLTLLYCFTKIIKKWFNEKLTNTKCRISSLMITVSTWLSNSWKRKKKKPTQTHIILIASFITICSTLHRLWINYHLQAASKTKLLKPI